MTKAAQKNAPPNAPTNAPTDTPEAHAAAQRQAALYPLKYDVKIYPVRTDGALKANATVNLNDAFAVRNIRIMEGSRGLFVSMPSFKGGNGEYKDICFPVTKEFREQLNQAVLDAYHQALTQSQNQGQAQQRAATPPFEQAPEQGSGMKMAGL